MQSHVTKHLSHYGVLTYYQHGFRAKQSTETQIKCAIHDIVSAIQSKKTIQAAILDFSIASAKVPHRRLLTKLDYYGVRGSQRNVFESFLIRHTQSVRSIRGGIVCFCSHSIRPSPGNGLRAVVVVTVHN